MLSSRLALSAYRSSSTRTDAGRTAMVIAPGFDWFYAQDFSVGMAVGISHSDGVGFDPLEREIAYTRTRISARARYGINAPLSHRVSFYPQVSLGYGTTSHSLQSDVGGQTLDTAGFDVSLTGPLLVHFDHLFVGFGATFAHDLARYLNETDVQNRATRWALARSPAVGSEAPSPL